MHKNEWINIIRKQCQDAGTYKEAFDSVIDSLAGIMENRDEAREAYRTSGSEPCIIRTTDRGEKNLAKNPLLVLQMNLDAQALQYWRDLGLTPVGYRKLTSGAAADTVNRKFEEWIEALEKID